MSELKKHTELPFNSHKGLVCNGDKIIAKCYTYTDSTFIVEACNNYYKLNEQNEALQNRIISLEQHIERLGGIDA